MYVYIRANLGLYLYTQAERRASEEAALQRMRDQARYQEEMDKRKNLEDQLRAEASRVQDEPPIAEGDLAQQVDRLQKIELRQRQEIDRYIDWSGCHLRNQNLRFFIVKSILCLIQVA